MSDIGHFRRGQGAIKESDFIDRATKVMGIPLHPDRYGCCIGLDVAIHRTTSNRNAIDID